MRFLGAIWLAPLAIHLGYAMATYTHLPPVIGTGPGDPGTTLDTFYLGWFAITGIANGAFVYLYLRLPRFSANLLRVPGHNYWLATPERKNDLVERLRGICETALFSLNVFFAAVFQAIYQSNAASPYLIVPLYSLVIFFMALPILVLAVTMVITVAQITTTARNSADN
jgi:hypothetical protein